MSETIKLPGITQNNYIKGHSESCLKFNNKKYVILSEEM